MKRLPRGTTLLRGRKLTMVINHLHLHPGMILQIRWVFDQQNLYFLTLTVFTEFSPEKSPDEKRLRNISPPSLDPSHNEYDLSSQVNQNWLMVEPTHLKNITLQETNISPQNGILKMIFLFPRWDMLIPWRVVKLGSSSPIFGMKIKNV